MKWHWNTNFHSPILGATKNLYNRVGQSIHPPLQSLQNHSWSISCPVAKRWNGRLRPVAISLSTETLLKSKTWPIPQKKSFFEKLIFLADAEFGCYNLCLFIFKFKHFNTQTWACLYLNMYACSLQALTLLSFQTHTHTYTLWHTRTRARMWAF